MSREIKFVAFDNNLKEIIPVDSIDFEKKIINKNGIWRFFDEVELMQDTGIRDKHDKKIYEGYIIEVTWANKKKSIKYIVKYVEDCAYYMLECVTDEYELDAFCGYSQEQLEVIGNIYENPELLVGEE